MPKATCSECGSDNISFVEVRMTWVERNVISINDGDVETEKDSIKDDVIDSMANEDFLRCRACDHRWNPEE
jgi:hypothetical protein